MQQQRAGTFTYTIGKLQPSGQYSLRLDFEEEVFTAAGKRKFNVSINGKQVLSNFDIFSAAGAANTAVGKSFSTSPDSNGNITVAFSPTLDNATVSALELAPAAGSSPDPASACWTNGSPIPVGYGLVGHPVGPTAAADPYHIDWVAFCSSHASNCDGNGNPHYVNNDSAMIAATLPSSIYDAGITFLCSGATVVALDQHCPDQVGVYYAASTDPLVTINVKNGSNGGWDSSGNSGSINGSQIFIPSNAIAQTPTDGHMSIHEPNGVVCQLYQVQVDNSPPKPISGSSVDVADAGCALQDLTNEGTLSYLDGHSGYAAQMETSRGLIRAEDIVGNNGDGTDSNFPNFFSHGVYGGFENNQSGVVWPAIYGDGQCTQGTSGSTAMPVEGMYLYLDSAGYSIVTNWSPPVYLRPLKRFLGTLHKYGMIDLDSSGCSTTERYANTLTWGPQAIYQANGSSLFDGYLKNYIQPNESSFSPNGPDGAVYTSESGNVYAFALLLYADVPGLSASNFHWLAGGCGQLAVKGTTGSSSC